MNRKKKMVSNEELLSAIKELNWLFAHIAGSWIPKSMVEKHLMKKHGGKVLAAAIVLSAAPLLTYFVPGMDGKPFLFDAFSSELLVFLGLAVLTIFMTTILSHGKDHWLALAVFITGSSLCTLAYAELAGSQLGENVSATLTSTSTSVFAIAIMILVSLAFRRVLHAVDISVEDIGCWVTFTGACMIAFPGIGGDSIIFESTSSLLNMAAVLTMWLGIMIFGIKFAFFSEKVGRFKAAFGVGLVLTTAFAGFLATNFYMNTASPEWLTTSVEICGGILGLYMICAAIWCLKSRIGKFGGWCKAADDQNILGEP